MSSVLWQSLSCLHIRCSVRGEIYKKRLKPSVSFRKIAQKTRIQFPVNFICLAIIGRSVEIAALSVHFVI